MRRLISALALSSALVALPALAQEAAATAPAAPVDQAATPAPGPATLDALMTEFYAVISGEVGPRDWDRFNALFYPNATLMPTGRRRDGTVGARIVNTAGYIAENSPFFAENGFFEREIGRSPIRSYGAVVQFQSVYEARHNLSDAQPFLSGVNSITAFNDGKRWWLMTVAWTHATPDNPLPADILYPATAVTP